VVLGHSGNSAEEHRLVDLAQRLHLLTEAMICCYDFVCGSKGCREFVVYF
jgi:hypothetical protein